MIRTASQVGLQDQTKPKSDFRIVQLRLEMPKQAMAYSLVPPGPREQKVCQRTIQMALILQCLHTIYTRMKGVQHSMCTFMYMYM